LPLFINRLEALKDVDKTSGDRTDIKRAYTAIKKTAFDE
jgi:hypothetical protein